jgi:hypothetical protein
MRVYELLVEASPQNPNFVTLYRGDSEKIAQYDIQQTDALALFGQGIYLTDNKRVANDYKSKGNQDRSIIWSVQGRNLTKEQAIQTYVRLMGKYLDYDGKPMSFGQQIDYGITTRDQNGNLSPNPKDVKRVAVAWENWKKQAPQIEIRKQLDGRIIFRKKDTRAVISVFQIPIRVIQKMINAEEPISDGLLHMLEYHLRRHQDDRTWQDISSFVKTQEWDGSRPSFRGIFTNIGADSPLRDPDIQKDFRMELLQSGCPGIVYQGGLTMGGGYKHKAYVFWDNNTVNKYRVA